ncbi:TRAP transporter small permease [Falsiroseomonas sp.]|uniref:TRAP transporter small permease n=1 Tax=Falsiroseomonas sp. TaxID=2870721 RepID=UPI00271D8470|nr:TRAP transporter small permease [Falsiroseomonas sp.]MDO9500548.1 TRAP transporter small permease [Falsiroseomonas sp.]
MRALDRGCALLGRALDLFLAIGGGGLCLVVLVNVIARYVFNLSLAWVNEIGEFVFLWLTFLGGARALQLGAHLSITEMVDAAGPGLRRILGWVADAAAAGVLVTLLIYGWSLSAQMMQQTLSVTYIPMGLAYAAMPVGSVFGLIFIAQRLLCGPVRERAA